MINDRTMHSADPQKSSCLGGAQGTAEAWLYPQVRDPNHAASAAVTPSTRYTIRYALGSGAQSTAATATVVNAKVVNANANVAATG